MKRFALLAVLICSSSCARAGALKFSFIPPATDNGAICPALADTIQATNTVDALMSWTGPVSGSDSLLAIPRLTLQTVNRGGVPAGAYTVHVILRDAGGLSCDASKVVIVKGPPSRPVIQ